MQLIDARQYVLESRWGDVQPSGEDENAFLASHSWDQYAEWHLGLTDGANDETKARYAFVYGDFRRVHRMGLIACQYSRCGMAAQGCRAGGPRPPAAPRRDTRVVNWPGRLGWRPGTSVVVVAVAVTVSRRHHVVRAHGEDLPR